MMRSKVETFELTNQHIDLLRNMTLLWDDSDFGAPAFDSKRPYGNSGRWAIARDAGEILGIEMEGVNEYDKLTYTDEQRDEILDIHCQTRTALEIILDTMSFECGVYHKTSTGWIKKS